MQSFAYRTIQSLTAYSVYSIIQSFLISRAQSLLYIYFQRGEAGDSNGKVVVCCSLQQ